MPARNSCVRTTSTTRISAMRTRSITKMRRSALTGMTIAFWLTPASSDQVAHHSTRPLLLVLGDAHDASCTSAAGGVGGNRDAHAAAAAAAVVALGQNGGETGRASGGRPLTPRQRAPAERAVAAATPHALKRS